MSHTPPIFTLEALQAQVDAEAAMPPSAPPATPPSPPAPPTAAPAAIPAPVATPTADDASRDGYVDLETWRADAPSPTPPSAATDDSADTRYRVLKGKYDAEVPRLQARIRELEAQTRPQDTGTLQALQQEVQALKRELETVRIATPASATDTPPAAPAPPDLDDEDLVFEYGEAGAKVIRDLRQQIGTLQQHTEARIGSIEARDATRTREAFRGRLVERLGEQRNVFDEAGWAEFVQQRNPYVAGKTYNTTLIEADAAGDADTILNIVNAYRQHASAPAPAPSPDPFDALAVPARVQASGAPSAGARFRAGDLDAMVKKWQRGEKSFAELQSFERAFTAAQRSGRVDP